MKKILDFITAEGTQMLLFLFVMLGGIVFVAFHPGPQDKPKPQAEEQATWHQVCTKRAEVNNGDLTCEWMLIYPASNIPAYK